MGHDEEMEYVLQRVEAPRTLNHLGGTEQGGRVFT